MPDVGHEKQEQTDVVIIGGGPAGLSAAIELKKCGIPRVIVLERESEAGGIPRHCGHIGFGVQEFRRILAGPDYSRKLVQLARRANVEIRTSTTVVEAREGGVLKTSSNRGEEAIWPRRVVYSTGCRESSRAARLISGSRPLGIMNTGALQSMIYLKELKPFQRPIIVGTELVSFSAILTCRHAGIQPVAMLEQRSQVTAHKLCSLYPKLVGVPLLLGVRLVSIAGRDRVTAAEVQYATGAVQEIECDGVILTGQFTPEASLAMCGHLHIDRHSRGPTIDQYFRCSDPAFFATGNVLRPVETAGWSWKEGRRAGRCVAEDLGGGLPATQSGIRITPNTPIIRFCIPQMVFPAHGRLGMKDLQLRFSRPANGSLIVKDSSQTVLKKRLSVRGDQRVLIPLAKLIKNNRGDQLFVDFDEG